MKQLWSLAVVMAALLAAYSSAVAQDEQYLQIYTLIQEGDGLRNSQPAQALNRYIQARASLERIQRVHPAWNPNVVTYRLNYVATRIGELSAIVPRSALETTGATSSVERVTAPTPVPVDPVPELQNQLAALRAQVQELQGERAGLEAKLREALAVQPAALDPAQLANAEERIRSLEKENDLLKVSLAERASSPAASAASDDAESPTLATLKEELDAANRQLAAQTEQAKNLALEKQALQNRLASLIPAAWNSTNIDATRQRFEDAERRLAEQTRLAEQLAAEKVQLEQRSTTLTRDAEAATALRAENEILKKQLADARSVSSVGNNDMERQLSEARATIATLQSEKEILRLERIALEGRVKKLSAPGATPTPAPNPTSAVASAAVGAADSARLKQIESERDDLQKRLAAAERELYGRNSRSAASRVADLTGQLDVLRTRLQVLEAQKVPYTPEELALFQKPEAPLADPRARQRSVRELPAGTATIVAQAQRDFAARRFDRAEEAYLQVLKRDNRNATVLANLATIQMEMNRLDEADKHIQQAIAEAPDDAYSYSILGTLRFRQERYDEALDALSRAARLDPRSAEIQANLGMVLSEKGMRAAAETALRRAIQLDPHYAKAHHNLAVIYITQKSPAVELARLHYRKALEAGMPANPELEKLLNGN